MSKPATSPDLLDELEARAKRMQMPYISTAEWDQLDEMHGAGAAGICTMFYAIPGDADLWHVQSKEMLIMVARVREAMASRVTRMLTK